jgi:hypothetical protein
MRRILVISDHQHPEPTRNQTISQNHTINIWDQCGTIPEGEFGYNWSGYKDTGGGYHCFVYSKNTRTNYVDDFFISELISFQDLLKPSTRFQVKQILKINYYG